MGYLVYNTKTTAILGGHRKVYKTHAAALAALTRFCKKSGILATSDEYPLYNYGVAEVDYFKKNIEKRHKVVNIMTGVEVWEPVNTPHYCSVGSETYWSM